ncbi:MAG: SwmB domain-containing protein, partial [Deltaproteobacteria bacterium]|nr:SwmB domain-containing protein [Deltaproteobacteria bacterium]
RHYRVSAINSVGTGAASDTASATTDTLPGKPTGLSASRNGGTRIDLSWTAPSVTGDGAISGYRVEVSSDSGSTFSDLEDDTESTTTTYAHTGLSASTTRHYRVSAITSVGTGPASDTASATTASDATLPTITSAAVTGSEATLAFSEALDTASRPAASAFTLTAEKGGVTRTISGKTSRVQLYGTSAAVSFVAAADADEELTLSYTAPATNPLQDTAGNDMASFSSMSAENANTTTQRPASFSADTASFSIAESHADGATVGTVTATDADGDTLTYSLASGGDNDSFSIGSGTGVITVRSGVQLDHEAKASHSLTAQVSDGQDPDGNPAAIDDTLAVTVTVTNVEEPPGAPTAVVVSTTGTATLTVRWSAPADVGAGVEGYTLRYRVSGGQWRTDEAGAGTAAVLGGLTPATAYEVQVRAHGDGTGPWSASRQGTTAAPATTPTVPRFVGGSSATSFALDAPHEDAAQVGRVVASDADGDTLTYSLASGGDNDSFTIDDAGLIRVKAGEVLPAGTQYTVTVQVTDGEDANGAREAVPVIDDTLTVTVTVPNVTGDTTVPTLDSAAVSGTTLTLTFSEDLDTAHKPATGQFAISGDNSSPTIDSVTFKTGDSSKVELGLSAALTKEAAADVVTVTYTQPSDDNNKLQDSAANFVATGVSATVTGVNATDKTAPTFSSATVNGATLTFNYNEALDTGSTPATTDFTVSVAGTDKTPSGVSVSGSSVILTLATADAVTAGRTVTVSYTAGTNPIRDLAQNNAAALSGQAVTNVTGVPTRTPTRTPAWLSRFGRTVGTHVLDAVGERLRATPDEPSQVTVGGYQLPLEQPAGLAGILGLGRNAGGAGHDEPGLAPEPDPRLSRHQTLQVNLRQALLGSSFRLNLNPSTSLRTGGTDTEAAIPRVTAWGRFAGTTFQGTDEDLTLDGDVLTGTVGVDGTWGRWLGGLAVAHSRGDGTYALPPATRQRDTGGLEQTLTSLQPYLRYAVTDRLDGWGLLGYGWGEIEVAQDTDDTLATDTTLLMGAVGGRGLMLTPEDTWGVQLATRTDLMFTRTTADATANSVGTDADGHRLRVILEGSRRVTWAHGRTFTRAVELGLRHDWGDAETGFGLEVGGRLQYADPGLGLTVDAAVRGLLAHENQDYDEWGASGAVQLDLDKAGQGLSLTLAPAWGATASGVQGLWTRQTTAGLAPQGPQSRPAGRLAAEVGYGLALWNTGLVTPYAGTVLADGADRTYRLGTRLQMTGGRAAGLTLTLEGLRQEPAGPQPVNHGLQVQATWGF